MSKFNKETKELITRTVAKDLDKDELDLFIYTCERTDLDPLSRQIYAIPRGGKMTVQTSIDGFRLIAERTGKYSPGNDTEFIYNEKGYLLGAKVYVKKMTADGTWHNISATAFLSEYNSNQGLWRKMPHVMVEKAAESRALRRAFPADLSGLYSKEEMEQADTNGTPTDAVKHAPDPIIGQDTWDAMDDYLNGHDELRQKLKELCKVEDLRNMKKSQLKAAKNYVSTYLIKKNDSSKNTEKESEADQLDDGKPSNPVE